MITDYLVLLKDINNQGLSFSLQRPMHHLKKRRQWRLKAKLAPNRKLLRATLDHKLDAAADQAGDHNANEKQAVQSSAVQTSARACRVQASRQCNAPACK